ncbi:MAG: FtsX-like permease family protein [Bacillota bacterium]|nr:FtsX-like permease family protein [Bacillota bacterium]
MKLFELSVKNASVKWWRSLTLGFFIFCVTFVLIMSNSFILSAKRKVESVVQNGITGQIEIRNQDSMEDDMAAQYSMGWDALKPIKASNISAVYSIIKKEFPEIKKELLVRQSVFFTKDDKRTQTMLIGIGQGFDSYKEAFMLSSGRYLDPASNDEILLTEEHADSYKIKVGDSIEVSTKNMYGLESKEKLKVVGIGSFIMLSLFSYNANYTSMAAVRQLSGISEDEATDIILFTPAYENPALIKEKLAAGLKGMGIKYSITKDEKMTSNDLKVTDLKFDEKDEGVKLSDQEEMGKTFKGASGTMFMALNIFIAFMVIIVSILIINLVYMTGLERFREIGTLRAIGFSRLQVIKVFMGEIVLVSAVAAVLAALVGIGLIYVLGYTGIESPIPAFDFIMGKTLNLVIDVKSIAATLLLITGVSLGASFYPAYKACSVDPAQAIRTV